MKIIDTWIKSEPVQKALGYGVAGLMWLFHLTVRWHRHVDPQTQALLDAGKPLILCMWHGRMFFLSGGWAKPPQRLGVVASAHRDGRLVARGAEAFGYETVLGSSRRGGVAALRGMSRLLDQGVTVVITPDGPKGPRMRFKAGAAKAAQMTGAPLVAVTGSARPRKLFATWDRFCLPLPFARGEMHFGPPVFVPREADTATLERCRQAAEDSLNALTNAAERALGQTEIRAADVPREGRRGAGSSEDSGRVMRAPDFWRHDGALARLLSPLALAWQWAGTVRRAAATPRRVPVPVFCVGNLVAGGAGKTPVVLSLLEQLTARGLRPAALTRGYGGTAAGPLQVDPARHDAALVGDEALLLARSAPTWVARDRVDGAREAVEEGADIIVMDDGFQNPGLGKDLSLLVIDSGYGLGNGRVMPAGPLRETAAAGIARADAVVLIGEKAIGETEKNLVDKAGLPLLRARLAPRDRALAESLKGQRVYAFAGIGRPAKFFETLAALGAELAGHEAFADHQAYDAAALQRLERAAAAAAARLVTTAKDAARLGPALPAGTAVLDVELQWEDKGALLRLLEPHLPTHPPETAAPMTLSE